MAESVDMLGDALVYALSLYALDRSVRWRAGAAVTKGLIIFAFGIGILIQAISTVLAGSVPLAPLMAWFGALALAANLACLRLLWPVRSDDVNMRSTFECSRNDVIANVGVLLAALAVAFTDRSWPDITVGLIVAALFLRSAFSALRQAWPQLMGRADSRRVA